MNRRPAITRLENTVQHYAWGSPTAIPDLLGVPNPEGKPCAELWIGAHPKAPSRLVLSGDRPTLDDAIAASPEEILGDLVAARWDGRLPFLLKILAAAEPLSIQCHPGLDQAREGFDRENRAGIAIDSPERNYRDANHKPELIVAVTPFHALRGFRAAGEIRRLLDGLGSPEIGRFAHLVDGPGGARTIERLYRKTISLPRDRRAAIATEAARSAAGAAGRAPVEDRPAYEWVATLHDRYPGDIGVLSPLLLNLVVLDRDEALFLDAGTLHAYLDGVGVEIMANSDNVLRGGLTPKHVDVPELLRTIVFDGGPATVLRPGPTGATERSFDAPVDEFALSVIDVDGEIPYAHPAARAIEILLVTEGEVEVDGADGSRLTLRPGGTALIPACSGAVRIRGRGRVFRARVPSDGEG